MHKFVIRICLFGSAIQNVGCGSLNPYSLKLDLNPTSKAKIYIKSIVRFPVAITMEKVRTLIPME